MPIVIYDTATNPDIYYHTAFLSDVHVLFVDTHKTKTVYVPGFEYLRAKKEITRCEVKQLHNPKELVRNIQSEVQVDTRFPYYLAQEISAPITVVDELYTQRHIKSPDEIREITHAQELAKQASALIQEEISQATIQDNKLYLEGELLTSELLKYKARKFLLSQQADCPELIVSSGSQTGVVHHTGSGAIQPGPIIIDIFPQTHTRYCGDYTRTAFVGKAQQAREMYQAVTQAQQAVIKQIKPGVRIQQLAITARDKLTQLGYDTADDMSSGFIHSLGHAVGLEVHERPIINYKQPADNTLQKGMVLAIEPGLYYDIGVRYEDLVLVTEDGCQIL